MELKPSDGSSLTRRQSVIDALCEAFARDQLTLPELERRLDLANRARTEGELRTLLDGVALSAPTEGGIDHPRASAPSTTQLPALIDPARVPERQFTLAFWGGRSRKGSWIPARRIQAIAIQGGVELDFREALFGPGVTELRVFALMGGIVITVPPHLQVECSGFAVMGGFDDETQAGSARQTDGPILRVSGLALMGGVEVRVRLPGESERESKERMRREKRERKEGRRELKDGRRER